MGKLFNITCTWIRADNLLEKSFLSDPPWDQVWHHPRATDRNANKLHYVEKLVSNTHELSWNQNRNTHGGQGFLQALCRLSPGKLCRGAFREGCSVTQEPSNQKGQWEGDQLGEQCVKTSWCSSPTEPLQNPAPATRSLWGSNESSWAEVFSDLKSEDGDDTFLAGC